MFGSHINGGAGRAQESGEQLVGRGVERSGEELCHGMITGYIPPALVRDRRSDEPQVPL
jgi:hypothetical protein